MSKDSNTNKSQQPLFYQTNTNNSTTNSIDANESIKESNDKLYDDDGKIQTINPDNIQIKTSSIKCIYESYLKENRTDLQPSYQRSIAWKFDKMLLFLDSLYNCPIIPAFILYKLNKSELASIRKNEPNTRQLYECIDGQHRFWVIYKFMKGESVTEDGQDYLYIKSEDDNMKLFYNLNDNIRKKYKTNIRELNIDEKNKFDETNLSIQIITQSLNDISKRNLFNRLQNGENVSKLDTFKNVEHIITNYLRENNYFDPEVIVKFWKDIILLSGVNDYKSSNIRTLIYFTIRLIINTENKNINVTYTDTTLESSIINNTEKSKIGQPMDTIFTDIRKYREKIIEKAKGRKLTPEFYLLINNLLVNKEITKFNNLSIIFNNYLKFKYFNEIGKKTTINKDMKQKYDELLKLL